ncbi:Extradiol aromatic ring-opening dioxygenase [Xylariaceae sp. FL0255]|nr:Extradiol aromatic ring-opening dioxygenase [Xylariaceae sp. FL0255]
MDSNHSLLSSPRPHVYFLGIGGPNLMENTAHTAFVKLGEVGREITTQVKPKAVVVFSAHWQNHDDPSGNCIKINVAEHTNQIYDFYGFPPHYYEYKYPYQGSPEIAEKVASRLQSSGFAVERVARGLDHGVWVGLIAAFDPERNPLNVPIVQVSLLGNEDTEMHYRLGQAIEGLRDEGILIIGAGMAVHNLHDFRRTRGFGGIMPYSISFDNALKEVAASNPEDRQKNMLDLMKRSDARQAHPTFDHILPMHVVAGAAGVDLGEQIWTMPEGSLSWAQFRFGRAIPEA